MMDRVFEIKEDINGRLVSLGCKEDEAKMNWVEGNKIWGTVKCPEGIRITTERKILPNGHLEERFCFQNINEFPIFFQMMDVGIYVTFNDNYEKAETCMEQKCHTHIFCGGESSYVMAFRMSGQPPHLGLMLTEGSLVGYSIERENEALSNDRGDFILHPAIKALEPGETAEISWELFWFTDREEFEQILINEGKISLLQTKQCTYFPGETLTFDVIYGANTKEHEICICCNKQEIPFTREWDGKVTRVHCEFQVNQEGEYLIESQVGGKQLKAIFYVCNDFTTLVRNRCRFIADNQQYKGDIHSLKGAYLVYDNEEQMIYYSHVDDHNGGRERIGMGALIALWLQKEESICLRESLEEYVKYLYRELYDRNTGVVFNDISHNQDWHRMYNYTWMSILQIEMYHLTKKPLYLEDAYRTMRRYYLEGGEKFYAIGIPMNELVKTLEAIKMNTEAEELKTWFLKHADYILETGISYPTSEVNYEQSIVAPAVSYLLQAYQLSDNERYLVEAKKQLEVLYLFNGRQPDYHLFENAIRHWDGYWFGKYKLLGDTYPHYWSVLTGLAFIQYAEITDDCDCKEIAEASLRGCLNLFSKDGKASCAMVFPQTVNGIKAHYYDPWANDQDWALYYALKYDSITSGVED